MKPMAFQERQQIQWYSNIQQRILKSHLFCSFVRNKTPICIILKKETKGKRDDENEVKMNIVDYKKDD